jgi:hypothetical protein
LPQLLLLLLLLLLWALSQPPFQKQQVWPACAASPH